MDKYKASEPLATKLADVVGRNRISINMVWTLIRGVPVMFMRLGFAKMRVPAEIGPKGLDMAARPCTPQSPLAARRAR